MDKVVTFTEPRQSTSTVFGLKSGGYGLSNNTSLWTEFTTSQQKKNIKKTRLFIHFLTF
jgi:hypothetical protein